MVFSVPQWCTWCRDESNRYQREAVTRQVTAYQTSSSQCQDSLSDSILGCICNWWYGSKVRVTSWPQADAERPSAKCVSTIPALLGISSLKPLYCNVGMSQPKSLPSEVGILWKTINANQKQMATVCRKVTQVYTNMLSLWEMETNQQIIGDISILWIFLIIVIS